MNIPCVILLSALVASVLSEGDQCVKCVWFSQDAFTALNNSMLNDLQMDEKCIGGQDAPSVETKQGDPCFQTISSNEGQPFFVFRSSGDNDTLFALNSKLLLLLDGSSILFNIPDDGCKIQHFSVGSIDNLVAENCLCHGDLCNDKAAVVATEEPPIQETTSAETATTARSTTPTTLRTTTSTTTTTIMTSTTTPSTTSTSTTTSSEIPQDSSTTSTVVTLELQSSTASSSSQAKPVSAEQKNASQRAVMSIAVFVNSMLFALLASLSFKPLYM